MMLSSALSRRFLACSYLCPCLCDFALQPFLLLAFGCLRFGRIRYYFFLAAFFLAGRFLVAFFLAAFFLVAFFLVAFLLVAFFFVAFRFATFFLAAFLLVAFFFVAFFFVAFRFATFFLAAFFLVAFFLVALRFATFLLATFFLAAFFLVAFFFTTLFLAVVFFRLADFFFAAFFFAFAITKAPLKYLVEIKTQHHVRLYTSQQHDVQTIIVQILIDKLELCSYHNKLLTRSKTQRVVIRNYSKSNFPKLNLSLCVFSVRFDNFLEGYFNASKIRSLITSTEPMPSTHLKLNASPTAAAFL